MKKGLVLEGGAMRGIFTAGALDFLLEQDEYFDYICGVSAGGGNALNYVSRQKGRTKKTIMHENARPYYGLSQMFENRKILNLETLIKEYALDEIPFDFDAFDSSPVKMELAMVNCETGKCEYHGNPCSRDMFFRYSMATCSVPFICEPVEIDGNHYLDGSIVDSLPAGRAFENGCDKVLVILTKPEGGLPTDYSKMRKLVDKMYGQYPKLCDALCSRKAAYSAQLEFLDRMVEEGKVFILRPREQMVRHFENSQDKLNLCYQYGYDTMKEHFEAYKQFMNK